MSDTRQQLIAAIDTLTPEQQRRALKLLRSLSSGEAGPDAPSAHGDGAANQPPATESRDENQDEPSQEEINRRLAALDDFIGSVSHDSLAQDTDDELYASEDRSEWTKRAIQRIDKLADADGHEPVENDEIDKIIYGL